MSYITHSSNRTYCILYLYASFHSNHLIPHIPPNSIIPPMVLRILLIPRLRRTNPTMREVTRLICPIHSSIYFSPSHTVTQQGEGSFNILSSLGVYTTTLAHRDFAVIPLPTRSRTVCYFCTGELGFYGAVDAGFARWWRRGLVWYSNDEGMKWMDSGMCHVRTERMRAYPNR